MEEHLHDLLAEIRQMMLDRHRKYGAGNIAKHGLKGLEVRLGDKLARIEAGNLDHADESFRDTWRDIVGYGLIGLLWIDGRWPRTPTAPAASLPRDS